VWIETDTGDEPAARELAEFFLGTLPGSAKFISLAPAAVMTTGRMKAAQRATRASEEPRRSEGSS
jgi:hypothetical protein